MGFFPDQDVLLSRESEQEHKITFFFSQKVSLITTWLYSHINPSFSCVVFMNTVEANSFGEKKFHLFYTREMVGIFKGAWVLLHSDLERLVCPSGRYSETKWVRYSVFSDKTEPKDCQLRSDGQLRWCLSSLPERKLAQASNSF